MRGILNQTNVQWHEKPVPNENVKCEEPSSLDSYFFEEESLWIKTIICGSERIKPASPLENKLSSSRQID